MKSIEYYMNLPYRIELIPDPDEGGYVVSFPDLPGCLSIGYSLDEAYTNAMEAKRVWLEAAINDGITIHEPDSLNGNIV